MIVLEAEISAHCLVAGGGIAGDLRSRAALLHAFSYIGAEFE